MKLGTFDIDVVRDGTCRLDGGAMFGIIPRPLWERVAPPDEQNRIELALNPMLVRTGKKNVLIDTGIGDIWSDKEREIYGIEKPETLAESLEALGLSVDDIDIVMLTHLHFDHCGGSTRRTEEGQIVPTFPNAIYTVQKGDWEVAHHTHERNRGSYRPVDFDPLEASGQLRKVEGDVEVAPGIRYRVTGGHAKYHAVVLIESGGATAIYWADIIPTTHHLKLPYIMGYDLFPEQTLEAKRDLLKQACDGGWVNLFEHDRQTPGCFLKEEKRGYAVKEVILWG